MIKKAKAKIINKPSDYYSIKDNVIIVVKNTTPEIVVAMQHIVGIIAETNNLLSHAAIIAREYRKPYILGFDNATKKIKNGQIIGIDIANKKVIC